MENTNALTQLLSASAKLKLAFANERQKSQYATAEHDPCLTLWVATAVRRNNPEAFDLNNPADLLIWTFVRG